jgi:hypothetical protein
MNNFINLKNRFAEAALSRFGESVRVNGIEYTAIYEEQEIENETGYSMVKTLMFKKSDLQDFIKRGDPIEFQYTDYVVDRISVEEINNPLVMVEIKRA